MSSDAFVQEWAQFVRDNPQWKKIHAEFINAQFQKSDSFLKRLAKEPKGKEKIIKMFEIKNVKGYARLLDN